MRRRGARGKRGPIDFEAGTVRLLRSALESLYCTFDRMYNK